MESIVVTFHLFFCYESTAKFIDREIDSKHSVILLSVFVIATPTKREFFHTRIGIIYVVFTDALFF